MKTALKIGLVMCAIAAVFWVARTVISTEMKLYQDGQSHSVKGDYYKGPFRFKTELLYRTASYSEAKASWVPGVVQAFTKPLSRGEAFYYRSAKGVFFLQLLEVATGQIEVSIGSPTEESRRQLVTSAMITLPNGESIRWSSRDGKSVFIYADDYLNRRYEDLYEVSEPFSASEAQSRNAESLRFSRLPWEQS